MAGRDNPRVVTQSGIRDLLSDSETLRAAGYESGDYIPILYTGGQGEYQSSTSATSYVNALENGLGYIKWDTIIPSNTEAFVWFNAFVNEAPIDVRIYNNDNNEVLCERTGIPSGNFEIAPEAYTPSTTSNTIQYRCQIRSPDGTTKSLKDGSIAIGVEV
jgi:hypothetical protein